MDMETKIKELKTGTFFIHENKIKCKKWIIQNRHWVATITMNLEQSSINELLMFNNKIVEMNPEEKVKLLNIDNWKLSIFRQSNHFWFLVNCEDFTFFNFTKIDETENKIMKQIESNSIVSKKQIYLGEIILTIENGRLDYDSVKFERNLSLQTEIEKINFLLLKEINDEKNLKFRKDYIFNNMFIKNDFFTYTNEVKKNLNLKEIIDFNLWKSLNILSFSVIEADFYTALINIRQIKNLIVSFIYENTFLNQNFNAKTLVHSLNWRIKILDEIKSWPYIIENELSRTEQEIKKLEKLLQDLEKWNKKYEKNKNRQTWKAMVEEWNFYHLPSIYFDKETFESVDQYLKNKSSINSKKVYQYIKKEILKDKNQKKNWERANYLTNNSIHKNNYDTERFQNWYLSKNELDILKKTLFIYIDVFKIFKEKHLGSYPKSYIFNN